MKKKLIEEIKNEAGRDFQPITPEEQAYLDAITFAPHGVKSYLAKNPTPEQSAIIDSLTAKGHRIIIINRKII